MPPLYHTNKHRYLTHFEETAFRDLARDGLIDWSYVQEREGIRPEHWLITASCFVEKFGCKSKDKLYPMFNAIFEEAMNCVKEMTFQELLNKHHATTERDLVLNQAKQLRSDLTRLIRALEALDHPLRPAAQADPKS